MVSFLHCLRLLKVGEFSNSTTSSNKFTMVSTPVSTASSFDAQMMQQVFDHAIEETCRGFGLFSPFRNELSHEKQEPPGAEDDFAESCSKKEETMSKGDIGCGALTYDGIIHKERLKKFPASYYHVEDMNKGPVDYAPRLARIPSQYQLESLTEVYVCDYPPLIKSDVKNCAGEMDIEPLSPVFEANHHIVTEPTEPHLVFSEYVSEMLY
ncbi:hypothetical protein Y032_0217g2392 [Ancylostoma ceylanicum]|uniref:Uncharacterized protein n=1 Tax=Ancylostoma ceylanicum TaxID=53326 RepID=A0A016SJS0_9BILA|nr:hypothetical protein Y032_0217g2392 [Ancylostoma ceylanicum]